MKFARSLLSYYILSYSLFLWVNMGESSVGISVGDPWHDFGTDQDPRIHTPGEQIRIQLRIRLRILLFSSLVTFKIATKINFFTGFFCFLLFKATFTYFSQDKKSERSHKTGRMKVFLLFSLIIEASGTGAVPRTNGSGSGRSKSIQIRIPQLW